MRTRPDDDRIAGFAWPLLRAFAPAAAACRFEQGDLVYGDARALEAWSAEAALPGLVVQVLDPPRSGRSAPGDAEGNRFQVNWSLPVTVEIHRDGEAGPERCVTTQGRLFTSAWRGDVAWLDPSSAIGDPPLGQRALQRRLAEAAPRFAKHFRRRAEAGGHCLLLLAVDDASDASRVKQHAVENVLGEAFDVEATSLSPEEAGIAGSEPLHPSLVVRGIAISSADPTAVERCLTPLLYGGAATGDDSPQRFSLARHGHLQELGRA